jgi:hypothetical protein
MIFSLLFIIFALGVVIYFVRLSPKSFETIIEESLRLASNRPKPFVKVLPTISSRISDKVVEADNTPVYLQRGWVRKDNGYHGYYRTQYGAWEGAIQRRGDAFYVFINDPPTEKLRHHSRWPCFRQETGKRWRIHLAVNPVDQDINSIILYVESVIRDSFRK